MPTASEALPPRARLNRQVLAMAVALGVTVPGVALRLTDAHLPDPVLALIFGASIVGAAFLLSWAAEAAQVDVSAGLAIGVLALIAVLPEYAVDVVFAVKGGNSYEEFGRRCPSPEGGGESPCSLALANMTGANRLLIGIGWTMVVFIAWWRWRQQGEPERGREITLARTHSVELAYLAIATLFSLTLPLWNSIGPAHAVVLVGIFVAYSIRISKAPAEEPDLVGPARWIGEQPRSRRRPGVVAMFLVAAAIILLVAEHFADALVGTGKALGVSEFLLVQWLAPLASEAPEFVVVGIFAWRGAASAAMGALVSSKINQWTLLVGMLPLVYAVALGGVEPLPLTGRQEGELFLTVAQTLFAVVIMLDLRLHWYGALILFGLFVAGFVWPDGHVALAGVYLALAIFAAVVQRREMRVVLRNVRKMLRPAT